MRRVLWLLPILAIVGGMLANFHLSGAASARVAALGDADYPALAASDELLVTLSDIEDLLKGAVAAGNKDGLQAVSAKAELFRRSLKTLAARPGWQAPAQSIDGEFGNYVTTAQKAASIMLGVQEGDVGTVAPAMQAAPKTLTEHLTENLRPARAAFDAGLQASADNVRYNAWANTVAALLTLAVCLGVAHLSVRHIQRQLGGQVALQSADPHSLLHAMKTMQGKLVEAGVRQIESAGSTMGQIVTQVGPMSGLIADIAQSSNAQSQGFGQINAAIRELEGMTQQNAALVEQAAAATGTLHQLARNVISSMSVFRLESSAAVGT